MKRCKIATMVTTESVKIEKETLDKVRKYCKINGLKLTFFISKTIKKELENKEKDNVT